MQRVYSFRTPSNSDKSIHVLSKTLIYRTINLKLLVDTQMWLSKDLTLRTLTLVTNWSLTMIRLTQTWSLSLNQLAIATWRHKIKTRSSVETCPTADFKCKSGRLLHHNNQIVKALTSLSNLLPRFRISHSIDQLNIKIWKFKLWALKTKVYLLAKMIFKNSGNVLIRTFSSYHLGPTMFYRDHHFKGIPRITSSEIMSLPQTCSNNQIIR